MRRLIAAVLLVALWLGGSIHAQPTKPALDSEVKAAYLFNFGRFAKWPSTAPAADNLFNVCVLGRDPFGSVLDSTLAGEMIDGLRVTARRIAKPPEAAGCRILYVGASEEAQLPAILQITGAANILTVSDIPQFLMRGGMIQFVSQGNRIRFEVNLTAVEQANLTLSSELLKVAAVVRRNGKAGA